MKTKQTDNVCVFKPGDNVSLNIIKLLNNDDILKDNCDTNTNTVKMVIVVWVTI